MRQVTLNIPENKYKFFIELVNNLGFERTEEIHISQEHKKIVRERINNEDPDKQITWKEARKQLHFGKE